MTDRPLVSVLMTAYNRDKYIAMAIDSVLASTYTNFELIIVDDASKDMTLVIAKQYELTDIRVKVYSNEKNLGDYPNRNVAASYATGKYLKYVDSDDYIYPDGLKILVDSMERFPAAGMGICSLKPDKERPFPFMLSPKESYEYHFFGPRLFFIGPLSVIFLKDAFSEVGGFLSNRMVSDNHMWYDLALHYPVVLISDGVVWARDHPGQELKDEYNYLREYEAIKWRYLLDPACRLTSKQVKKIRSMRTNWYLYLIVTGILRLRPKQVTGYIKCLYDVLKIRVK
jgi:glycosyltransferase involved in cell wall biosynthesis